MKELSESQIKEAINKLDNNEVVILPTDTIYGLSAVVNKDNEEKINALKKADLKKPLIILVSSIDDVKYDINYSKADIEKWNDKQPTTVICPMISNPTKTLAIRVVKRPDIKKIIEVVGPIFSTSVNEHGSAPLMKEEELNKYLGKENVFWTEELKASPSRIYDSITGRYIR